MRLALLFGRRRRQTTHYDSVIIIVETCNVNCNIRLKFRFRNDALSRAVSMSSLTRVTNRWNNWRIGAICRCVKSRRLPTNVDRRRSTLTSTTGQLMITQQNITLEDLMDRVHRDSLAPPTTQSACVHSSLWLTSAVWTECSASRCSATFGYCHHPSYVVRLW